MNEKKYLQKIFQISNENEFNKYALEAFNYQFKNNIVYKQYINLMGFNYNLIKHYIDIPFMPIELFKTKKIIAGLKKPELFFQSSGTTGTIRSKHYLSDLNVYKKSIINNFNYFFGDPEQYVFLCLVPDFKKNPHSSLAFMCNELIAKSQSTDSGFYIKKKSILSKKINYLEKNKKKFILFGLGFEILEFGLEYNVSLNFGTIIETGGVKRGSQTIIREDLHNRLKKLFKTKNIFSEYGMAELLSQSYFINKKKFQTPPWKKVLIRDKTNPLKIINDKRGCVNIIDLANIYSCCFIATNDSGSIHKDGFDILGRSQNSSIRGCNLMV